MFGHRVRQGANLIRLGDDRLMIDLGAGGTDGARVPVDDRPAVEPDWFGGGAELMIAWSVLYAWRRRFSRFA